MSRNPNIAAVGIVVNSKIERAVTSLRELIQFLQEKNIVVFLEEGSFSALKSLARIPSHAILEEASIETLCADCDVDAIVTLGGDGTVLRAARHSYDVPLLPINAGKRGFLAELESDTFAEDLAAIIDGSYFIEDYSRLQAESSADSSLPSVLNEYLITPSEPLRATSFDLYLGGEEVACFEADGLIISTPIGSSGHALSSGGPLIHHDLQVMQISWICPISRSARPIVFPNSLAVSIEATSPSSPQIKVICDGQIFGEFSSPLELKVTSSSQSTRFIRTQPFFHRKKTIKFLR
ncbi:MAG: NAD(+)/NADH kinase [Candidatus Heimdallarchaeota archaeon]